MLPASWTSALVEVAQVADTASTSDAASTRLTWVIWGLLALAVVIAVATAAFWWVTRPEVEQPATRVRWVGRRTGDAADRADPDE